MWNGWTICLNKLVNLPFLQKFWSECFSWRNIYLRKTYLFSDFSYRITVFFYKHSAFFWFRLTMFMIFLSWALYYAYKTCWNYWDHSESMYDLMEGRGETPKTCENIKEEGVFSRSYVNLCIFKRVFSHLNFFYLCFTSLMRKWKL